MKNILLVIATLVLMAGCQTIQNNPKEAGDTASGIGDIIFAEGLLHLIGW
ncbi:uncharacterized protein METZ01_LOCUS427198 [marine metagenome]|uniref:Uncharacterized protein n=1 Tax=marine metagenome TaxID=408172 RepID=A0A382XTZ8_9ZZZZ